MAAATPQPQDLTNLANVKAAMDPNIPTPSSSDAIIQQYITRASDAIAGYCSRVFQAQTYIENRNGYGTVAMRLKHTPAFKLTSVTVDGSVVPQSTGPLTGGWFLDDDGRFVYIRGGTPSLAPSLFSRGLGNVQFVYNAGWLTPGQIAGTPPVFSPAPANQPTDLEEAAVEMTILMMRQRTRIGDTGTSIGTERLNFYLKAATAFTKETIDRHSDNAYPLG